MWVHVSLQVFFEVLPRKGWNLLDGNRSSNNSPQELHSVLAPTDICGLNRLDGPVIETEAASEIKIAEG